MLPKFTCPAAELAGGLREEVILPPVYVGIEGRGIELKNPDCPNIGEPWRVAVVNCATLGMLLAEFIKLLSA